MGKRQCTAVHRGEAGDVQRFGCHAGIHQGAKIWDDGLVMNCNIYICIIYIIYIHIYIHTYVYIYIIF